MNHHRIRKNQASYHETRKQWIIMRIVESFICMRHLLPYMHHTMHIWSRRSAWHAGFETYTHDPAPGVTLRNYKIDIVWRGRSCIYHTRCCTAKQIPHRVEEDVMGCRVCTVMHQIAPPQSAPNAPRFTCTGCPAPYSSILLHTILHASAYTCTCFLNCIPQLLQIVSVTSRRM